MYPLITVHDAFACHASNAADLKDKLVSGLAGMYKHYDPLRAFLAQTEGGLQFLAPVIMDEVANGKEFLRHGNRDINASPHGAYPCNGEDRWSC